VCVLNVHGTDPSGAYVLVDADLNLPGSSLSVVLNTAQAAQGRPTGWKPVGSELAGKQKVEGTAYVEVRNVPSSEVMVLLNYS
jgi:hypothetical protein